MQPQTIKHIFTQTTIEREMHTITNKKRHRLTSAFIYKRFYNRETFAALNYELHQMSFIPLFLS